MASQKRAPLFALFVLALGLSGCGLGRDQTGDNGAVRNPIVAATIGLRTVPLSPLWSRPRPHPATLSVRAKRAAKRGARFSEGMRVLRP